MKKSKYLTPLISLVGAFCLIACSPVKQEEAEDNSQPEHQDDHSNHDMGQGSSMQMSEDGAITWRPTGDGLSLITSDFHFITGSLEDIQPEVIKETDDISILSLTLKGSPASFVFHQTYGNVGLAANLNLKDFNGTVKLIHHTIDVENYEFVSINASNMKLGRVVNGVENIFDEKKYEVISDWTELRVSAAGTHFKGYIGSETITHGHGDKMNDGYVGLMINGTGNILVKSIEIFKMEDE